LVKHWTPFISWSIFKSHDPNKPDILEIQVAEPELFTTTYSTNARVYQKDIGDSWNEKILPIKNHESFNSDLLKQWEEAFHKGWIRLNGHIRIKTWLDVSKKHKDRMIRRFRLIILD